MKTCCTLPDVVDIDAVKKVNGPGFEVGWQRYAPCPCSRPSAPVSTAVSGGVRAQFVDLAPASNRRVHVHRNAARVRDHGDHALDHVQSVPGDWVAEPPRFAGREVTSCLI